MLLIRRWSRQSLNSQSEQIQRFYPTASTDRVHYREQWLRTFDTNIHPFFYISKYALEHMKSGDSIINCASVNPYVGRPDLLDYTSTKGAIVAFTRGLSNQQVGNGIRVNAVCPGPGKLS